ncbi:flavin reductase family protein [Kitasatospora sp. LaBMicrA B282]|uniref:flavin reductase family protein n=1 Tax=Kitasatospora sp. LaBMicrA B282 TaxID=3420949 RepID=UPI003D148FB3
MRVDFDPQAMPTQDVYRLLTAVVVPRPIAWVSTVSSDGGTANLAPHSFFTISSIRPPIVQFTSVASRDSLRNVRETREFVVNLAPEPLMAEVNASGVDFPAEVDEFAAIGLATEPSLLVKPPRVAASPVALECRLHSTITLGDGTLVLGEVVHAVVDEAVLVDGHPEIGLLRPLSRLGRNEWGTTVEVVPVDRISYADWSRGERG